MRINISEIISTDYKVQTFNPEIEMEVFCLDGERYNFIRKSPVELKAQNEGHSVVKKTRLFFCHNTFFSYCSREIQK